MPETALIGAAAFAATNIDDLFLLAAFFAHPAYRAPAIVAGQFAGIGALTAVSALAARFAQALPGWLIGGLGLVPLVLGLWLLAGHLRGRSEGSGEAGRGEVQEARTGSLAAQAASVAMVTIANGGDNLALYVPLFASAWAEAGIYALVFAVLTGVWCFAGWRLVQLPALGAWLQRNAGLALPGVLILIGLHILAGAWL